jgi:hypothetical protein
LNIKQYVRQVLSNSEIINLTGDKKVHFLHAINPALPYVEYEIADEYGEEYAENEEKHTTYSIQVDIFSKTDYTNLEEKIKEKMKISGFGRGTAVDLYKKDTELYHKAMRFSITLKAD